MGHEEICTHQRLNCTGYVFSCASPPFTSAAVSTGLKLINKGIIKPTELRAKAKRANDKINAILASSLWTGDGKSKAKSGKSLGSIFENPSYSESPYIHLRLKKKYDNRDGMNP